MFARLAKHPGFARRRTMAPAVTPGFSTNCQADRQLGTARPHSRPVLLCRWRLDAASGRPVCAWEVVETHRPKGKSPVRRKLDRIETVAVRSQRAAACAARHR